MKEQNFLYIKLFCWQIWPLVQRDDYSVNNAHSVPAVEQAIEQEVESEFKLEVKSQFESEVEFGVKHLKSPTFSRIQGQAWGLTRSQVSCRVESRVSGRFSGWLRCLTKD